MRSSGEVTIAKSPEMKRWKGDGVAYPGPWEARRQQAFFSYPEKTKTASSVPEPCFEELRTRKTLPLFLKLRLKKGLTDLRMLTSVGSVRSQNQKVEDIMQEASVPVDQCLRPAEESLTMDAWA